MNYYDEIDPQGEDKVGKCKNCGRPATQAYCDRYCKSEDIL